MSNKQQMIIPEAKISKLDFKKTNAGNDYVNINLSFSYWDKIAKKNAYAYINGTIWDKFKINDSNFLALNVKDMVYCIIGDVDSFSVTKSKYNEGEFNQVITMTITNFVVPRVAFAPPPAETAPMSNTPATTVNEEAYDTMDIPY